MASGRDADPLRLPDAEPARYRALFELAPVAYLVTDLRGRIVETNAAAGDLLGVPPSYIVRKPLQLFAVSKAQLALRAFIAELLRTPGECETTLRMRRRTGVVFDASVLARSLGAELLWVISDVSEQRTAERQLWELNRELEAEVERRTGELVTVIDELPFGLAIVDGATAAVRRINSAALAILSLPPGGRLDAIEWRDEDGHAVPATDLPAARALHGERVAPARMVALTPDGRAPVVEVAAVPLRGPRGAVVGALVTFADVTASVRRARADREFVSNAAHQLRSPLTAIASSLAVLQSGDRIDRAAQTRFLDHVAQQTERMTQLTNSLLTLARAERGEEQPRPTVLALRPVLTKLAQAAVDAGAAVEVEVDERLAVIGNEELLVEALASLLDNAVRHAGDGARIVLRAAREEDGDVAVEVVDDGVGMERDVLDHAFERFYRPERANGGGFGLGLAIARASAEAAGGTLTLDSSPGAGTTARVRLRGARLV